MGQPHNHQALKRRIYSNRDALKRRARQFLDDYHRPDPPPDACPADEATDRLARIARCDHRWRGDRCCLCAATRVALR